MAELQSTDGSLFSRETDEEKSLESNDDNFSTTGIIGKDSRKVIDRNKSATGIGNDDNGEGALSSVKRSLAKANNDKNADNGVNDGGNNSDNASLNEKEPKKKAKKRQNLNEVTLTAIERYLTSGRCFSDTLEYEEVAAFALKIHRYAVERTRGRQGLLFRDGTIQNGDDENVKIDTIVMTDEDIAQEHLFHQIYQKEEYHAVATKFSKTVTEGCHTMGEPGFVLHTKTANWLKRAAGMQRQYDPYEKDDNQTYTQHNRPVYSEESDEGLEFEAGGMRERRLTRRRVQMNRKKMRLERLERQNENFRILSEVTLELANQTSTRRTKKRIKRPTMTSDVTDNVEDTELADTIARDVRGSICEGDFPSSESMDLSMIYRPHFRADAKMVSSAGYEEELYKIEKSILSPVVASLGLEFRSRPIDLGASRTRPEAHIKKKNCDRDSAAAHRALVRKSGALRNALSNKRARLWAVHEFFYSDLDKEWYRNDGFVSDLAELGLPIDSRTRMKREEWSLIRRKLPSRPRLFSKRFIAEQLKKRNRHRALVRKFQQDPTMKNFSPIPLGTPVTAYDKRGHTLRGGRILLHDPKKNTYLVQFNAKAHGCAVCLDSEVAASLPVKDRSNRTPAITPGPLYKSSKQFLCSEFKKDRVVQNVEIGEEILTDDNMRAIERELLISSIAITTEAVERKRAILEALESYTDDIKGSLKYRSRLLANLDRINSTLEAAISHVQVLYGRIYGSLVYNYESADGKIEKMRLSNETPKSKVFEELVETITSVSNKIGTASVSSGQDEDKSGLSSSEFLRNDFSGSSSLLLLANYLAEMSSSLASCGIEKTTYSKAIDAALKFSLEKYSKSILNRIPDSAVGEKRLKQESQVEGDIKELSMAVGMLRTEVALATDESRTFELRNAMLRKL